MQLECQTVQELDVDLEYAALEFPFHALLPWNVLVLFT